MLFAVSISISKFSISPSMSSQVPLWELKLSKATRAGLIRIRNESAHVLLREPLPPALYGEYVHMPKEQIQPQEEIKFGIVSRKIMTGTECEVAFVDKARPHLGRLTFHIDVNYIGDNRALTSAPPQFVVSNTHNGNSHLFEVTFVVRDAAPPAQQRGALSVPPVAEQRGEPPKSPRLISERVSVESHDWKVQMRRAPRSVFVAVNNRTPFKFLRRMCDVYHGTWRRAPPEAIEPNAVVEWGSESNVPLTGTDGRAVFEADGNANMTLVLAWDLPFMHDPECSMRVSDASVVVLKYVNAGHHSEVVFDLQINDGYGKPVFGFDYLDVVKGHGGMVMPRPLLDVVNQLTKHGATPANRGLFKGIPSYVELKELRTGVIVDKPLDLERFSPASLGAIVKMFLVELNDRPLAPLLAAHGGAGDPSEAGTKEARLLLDVLLELFAAVCTPTADDNARDESEGSVSGAAAVVTASAAAVSSTINSDADAGGAAAAATAGEPLTSHEVAIIFAPILACSPNDPPRETLRQMYEALRSFREHVQVLRMLIEAKLAKRRSD
jgi:hypothetical protein